MALGCSREAAAIAGLLLAIASLSECRQLQPSTGYEQAQLAKNKLEVSQVQLRGNAKASDKHRRHGVPTISNWDYSDHGQSWYEIGQCGEGAGQSPINVSAATSVANGGNYLYYRLHDYTVPVKMMNTEHGMEAELEAGLEADEIAVGTIFPSRVTSQFKLKGVDFHSPSEHTYRGVHVPVEMQLKFVGSVDEKVGDQTAVVAIGFYGSFERSSHTLESLRQGGLPPLPGDTSLVNGQQPAAISFKELFGPSGSEDSGFWSYEGSLSSPPCTGGVTWFVRDDALPSHPDALQEYKAAIVAGAEMNQDTPGNARELQGGKNRNVMWLSAVDALSLSNLKTTNATFDAAAQEAAEAQAAADAALDGTGVVDVSSSDVISNGTTAAPTTSTSALSPSEPYQVCVENLDRIFKDLKAAEDQRLLECQGQVQAQSALDSASEGETEQAAKVLNGQKTMCEDATVVATSLEAQAAQQKQQCDALAPSTAGR